MASGIRTSLVKISGEVDYQSANKCEVDCDTCEALKQSVPIGGRYIYFCHKGLAHIASVVFKGGLLQYGLFAGPLPATLSPEHKHSLSELLHYTASHLSYGQKHPPIEVPDVIARYIEQLQYKGAKEGFYPLEKEEELLIAMASGDVQAARSMLNELLGYIFFYSGLRFEVIRSRVLELIILLSRAAMKGGANPELIFGLNFDYLKEIGKFNTIEDLAQWLSGIMNRFTDHVFHTNTSKHSDVIIKATNYIKANYMRKISLDDVAGAVYLSPTYFSRIFKRETGSSFSAYLNRVRTDEGKQLLKNAQINISDIAGMIGYEDQSYFSKVFKKVTGMSPLKYRQTK
jgi:AraC-like DNA-binding protein